MNDISGHVEVGFERVAQVFTDNFESELEDGAAVAAYVNGRLVVDLWGGVAAPGQPWSHDTRCVVWSTTKGAGALCLQHLADAGDVDVTARVSQYWPEFSWHGKAEITVADVLTHRAGLPYWDRYWDLVTLEQEDGWSRGDEIRTRLGLAEPVCAPGAEMAYHAVTYGWLLDELIRRLTGQDLGQYFREHIARPLGLEFSVGAPVPPTAQIAPLRIDSPSDPATRIELADLHSPQSMLGRALLLVSDDGYLNMAATANSKRFRLHPQPAINGITEARSLARMYAVLAQDGFLDGVQLVSKHSISRHSDVWAEGRDLTLQADRRSALGYARPTPPDDIFGPTESAFGHGGMGGSIGFADPAVRLGFGYVMNRMCLGLGESERALRLSHAVYESL